MAKGFTVNAKQQPEREPVALYKIQEQDTTGWIDVTGALTKEDCKVQYDLQISQGTSPQRLKVIRVQ